MKAQKKSTRYNWPGLALGLLGCLSACGVDLEQVDPQDQTVEIWHQHQGVAQQALLTLIDDFNQTNAHGIQVRGVYGGSYQDLYDKMRLGLQGGELPQIVVAYHNQAKVYHEGGGIVDLLPYMDSPRWGLSKEARADYVQSFLEQNNIDGVQVAFRPHFSMEVLYYNADWLAELGAAGPPKTWADFERMCLRAGEQSFSAAANPNRCTGLVLDVDASRLASMVFSRGGGLMNYWGRSYTFNTEPMKDVLAMLQQLQAEAALEVAREPDSQWQALAQGRSLFALGSTSGLPILRAAMETGPGFAWDIAALPHLGSQPISNIYGGSMAVCRSEPEQQLAAWLFIKWLTDPVQQNRWVQETNYFPVRRSTAPELADYYQRIFDLLRTSQSEPAVGHYEEVRRLMENTLLEVLGGADLEAALESLQEAANKTLGEG